MIATAINAGDSIYFVDNSSGGLINALNAVNSTDCADIYISNDAADGLIATAADDGNLTDLAEDATGVLIDAINSGNLMGCSYITFLDDAADGLISISIAIDYGNLTDCDEVAAGG